jgi:hypothetical protein
VSDYLDDPRLAEAEAEVFEAEAAERRGDLVAAAARYHRAADRYAEVTFEVPVSLPRTRSVWAVSAVAASSRGRDFERAIALAERFLAEPDGLTPAGRQELLELLTVARSLRPATTAPRTKLLRWRDEIRCAA